MSKITVVGMGAAGVNVDKTPLELNDNELTQSANATSDTASGASALRKRSGLIAFSATATSGTVLGGVTLPLQDLTAQGVHYIYLGRGAA